MRLIPILANAGAITAGLALGTGLGRPEAASAADVGVEVAAVSKDGEAPRNTPVPALAPTAPLRDTFAFRRAFIVPVADGWRTQSLVVLSLELDRPLGAEPVTRGQEARLRDRLVAVLMERARDGAFADPLTDQHAVLEAALTAAARPVMVDADIHVAEVAKRPV